MERELDGPHKYHAIISYDVTDTPIADVTSAGLKTRGFNCVCTIADQKEHEAILDAQWLLLVVSKPYMENEVYEHVYDALMKIRDIPYWPVQILAVLRNGVDLEQIQEKLKPCGRVIGQSVEVKSRDDISDQYTDLVDQIVGIFGAERKISLNKVPPTNAGASNAWSYFYGLLNLILPSIDGGPDFRTRIQESDEYDPQDVRVPQKYFVIIPESCYIPPNIYKLDPTGKFMKTSSFLPKISHQRAGKPSFQYTRPFSKVVDEEGKEYFVVLDTPTILVSMYDMASNPLSDTHIDNLPFLSKCFYHALCTILTERRLTRTCAVLYYKDMPPSCDSITKILLNRIKREIEDDTTRQLSGENSKQDESDYNMDKREPLGRATSEKTDEKYPHALLDPCEKYSMVHKPRGKALILNFVNFETPEEHRTREGGDLDAQRMADVLIEMKFTVEVCRDYTLEQVMDILNIYSQRTNHEKYDCFVCVICSHGKEGQVIVGDGQSLHIQRVTEMFQQEKCPTLARKPKVFFIQACQLPSRGNPQAHGPAQVDADQAELEVDESTPGSTVTRDVEQDSSNKDSDSTITCDAIPDARAQCETLIPREKDFFLGLSTLPGRESLRHRVEGSLYITLLSEELRTGSHNNYLATLHNTVQNNLATHPTNLAYQQQRGLREPEQYATYCTTLTKGLLLNPL